MIILVQKPGKPTGQLTSLRPIVLLSVLRKTLSLIVLSRIAPKVDEYLSSSQSGFRRERSTVDVVFVTAIWRLFGHVLRLPRDAPAQRAIDHYFADSEAATFIVRPRTSLSTYLCSDLRRIDRTLRHPVDIEALPALSREQWRQMERDISACDELPYPLAHTFNFCYTSYIFICN